MLFKNRGKVFLCLFLSTLSFATAPKDISFFDDKPRSVAKDFYIYEYLKSKKCTSKEAWALLGQTSRMNLKLFHEFAKKLDDAGIKKASDCMSMETPKLLKTDRDCIAIGLSVYEATKLEKKQLKTLATLLEPYKEATALHVLSSIDIYQAMIHGDNDDFFETFNKVGAGYRKEYFDKDIPQEKLNTLAKDTRINQTIQLLITDNKTLHVNKSLLKIDANEKILTHQSLFFLGLNALKFNQKSLAMQFFEKAYKKAYRRFDKDKVAFWQYLVTKDAKYKQDVQESFDFNIYTILMEQEKPKIMIAKAYEKHPFFDEKDPFAWTKLLHTLKDKTPEQLEALAQVYLYGSSLPHFSYLMEKASGHKDHYFPLAYKQFLKGYDNKRVALILALARQESRFVPSAISTSYALGTMQFMPFLAKAIAKEKGFVDFSLEDMFNPETAYMFANIHLNYLEKYLYHPLFIAYAYNGGIGFTKRLLQKGVFAKGEYEPYMSMELVPYEESRKYGKKVLANYIMYMKILGEKVSVKNLFDDLTNPAKTDAFR